MEIINHKGEEELSPLPDGQVHVLIFPYPAQGHVTSMLKLAELLCLAGIHVTFLVTNDINRRLLLHSGVHSQSVRYGHRFQFHTIPDGSPDVESRPGEPLTTRVMRGFATSSKPALRDWLRAVPTTCIIADGLLSSINLDLGEEFGIPVMLFRTSSVCNLWAFLCVPRLIQAGELPFKDDNLDVPIQSIPGMNGFLRRRDLPSFIRAGDLDDGGLKLILNETLQSSRANALIFNTFEELEGPVLSQIHSEFPNVYTIGPLHELLKAKLGSTMSSNSLWEEDRTCITWLDSQPTKSVIFVSFGSTTIMTKDELFEFWYGLVSSGNKFLWVIRPDLVDEKYQIPTKLSKGTKERGYMIGWAPQQEVLAHEAVGGFLTHCGWNSTLESIVAGVPMICWPYFGDQPINSRFVGEVWKIGLDMKDMCDRIVIEKMIRDLMDVRREEFVKSADEMAKFAKEAIVEGGSSYCNLDRLIEKIRSFGKCDNPKN